MGAWMRLFLALAFVFALILGSSVFITPPAPQAWPFTPEEQSYGAEALQTLDIYRGAHCPADGCPVLLFAHGGGWAAGDKRDPLSIDMIKTFVAQGMTFVSINYRLAPAVTHPVYAADVARAIAWTAQHIREYEGNPTRLYLMGHSAGAQLVTLVTTDPSYLKPYALQPARDIAGVIAIDSSSYDLVQRMLLHNNTDPMISRAFDRSVLEAASPLRQVLSGRSFPPFFFIVANDNVEGKTVAAQFINRLRQLGARAYSYEKDFPAGTRQTHSRIVKVIGTPQEQACQLVLKFVGARAPSP